MKVCGVRDFSLRDMTQPDFPRTRRNLSAVINFWKFREERLENFNKLRSEMDHHEKVYKEKQRQLKEINAQIDIHKQQELDDKVMLKELEQDIENLSIEVNDLNQHQANLQKYVG